MAAEDERLAYELLSHHRHHHTGFAGFVFMAAETIGASPEQEAAISKIRGELKAKMKPLHEANAAVGNLLADGVASGKIDNAKVDAAAAKAAHVASELHPAVGTALEAIHKVLKPEQRHALSDKVEANWALWKEANSGDQVADNAKPDGHLSHVAKELSLTPEQVTKIKATLDGEKDAKKPFDVAAADAQMKAFVTAFVADTFDAKKAAPPAEENVKVVSRGSGRMIRFYEAMTPVLTPEQRTKVAEQLREHAREPLAEGTQ
jgi:Spy/CpxP family protein refolding chaperone